MSTRKLILTAIACGLAILIAGGAFFIRTATHRDELTVTNASVGELRRVGGVDVTLLSWRRAGAQIHATVRVAGSVAVGVVAAEKPWTMVVARPLAAESPIELLGDETRCMGAVIPQDTPLTCVLAFANAEGSPFLAFSLGGQQAQWRLAP